MKPTKHQRSILARMATGNTRVHWMRGFDAYYFISDTLEKVRWATGRALIDNGWIESNDSPENSVFVISKAGRKLLEAQDEGD